MTESFDIEKQFSPSNHISIERVLELDSKIMMTMVGRPIEQSASDVMDIMQDYTSQEVATLMSWLSVVTNTGLNTAGFFFNKLSIQRLLYARIRGLKDSGFRPKACSECPAMFTGQDGKAYCYFTMESINKESKPGNSCPFF